MKEHWQHQWKLVAMIFVINLCAVRPGLALVVSEIMYNPAVNGDKLEFVELYNNRIVSEDITGFAFTNGISYVFETETIIKPKEYLVVAKDPAALEAAYGINKVHGPFAGRLSNDGERIELSNANGEIVISFRYNDGMPWPVSADGTGHSLILARQGADPEEASAWTASTYIGGTPGGPDESADGNNTHELVVINELLANSDLPPGADWIELYNPGPSPIDLSNVYLSDDRLNLLRYKIPDGTILQPGQFWAVIESVGIDGFPFGLNSSGETIYVTKATNDMVPQPLRVLDAVRYGPLEPEVTFGRFPDGSDYLGYLSSATFDGPNAGPMINDIVINEIMYHHVTKDERYEYIELYNRDTSTVSLDGWAFTDGISYEFEKDTEMQPDSYLVIAKDPNLLESVYDNLIFGVNLLGPYTGSLNNHSERIRLSYPFGEANQGSGEKYMVTADEVTYYDGGRWPKWADGQGASLELRDPYSNNNTPDAWVDSDESSKTTWEHFSITIEGDDSEYTHDQVDVFGLMLLNSGEVLIDDLEMIVDNAKGSHLNNNGFENPTSEWRMLGNHVRSFITTDDSYSGFRSLHLIATGHGDPGANRINQSISSIRAGTVTLGGWARWLRGSRFLLLRTSRELEPVQPPRPAHVFELNMPLNLGTPGLQNTAFVPNRGPDILEVRHSPVLPAPGESIVVTAHVIDNDGVDSVLLYYGSDGQGRPTISSMVDDATGDDLISGDGIFTATIPGAPGGTMRAFHIEASDGSVSTRFPSLEISAQLPERACLVYIDDTLVDTRLATYRIWLSDSVINTFKSRSNLSNELMDCTFVYNDSEVFYNVGIRFRGSPFGRGGTGWDPRDRHGYRIVFNPDRKFTGREEINLDHTDGSNRGPLQERASYWFYSQMGLQFSTQEYVHLIINGTIYSNYEDVQKIDGDYIRRWFPNDTEGYIHKDDFYFEYSAKGTTYKELDEGLRYDNRHPLLKETFRWGFEKRSHRENDNWDHVFDFAVAMNTSTNTPEYEQAIESVIHPEHFAKVLAINHALGNWDSYGYNGRNNYFYYALPEGKWYLLPWDIDHTLGGSGNKPNINLFSLDSRIFPEVDQFLRYPKYRQMYERAFADLVSGPWQTSYGTNNPPTAFDRFLDDAADALIAEGFDASRRNEIKQFVRDRRAYILTQIPGTE